MNAEIQALNERIERLEKIIVFLICSKNNFDDIDSKLPREIIQKSLQSHTPRAVKKLLDEYEQADAVIKEALSIYDKRLSQ